jgi:predicted tellurium resistance membrane protein TerC
MSAIFAELSNVNFWIHAGVILTGAIVAITTFALLIPLDSVPAATGVTIILSVAYALSILMWVGAIALYSQNPEQLTWLNTHILFLIVLPATIGATAMSVTSVQNTRNLIAGQIV